MDNGRVFFYDENHQYVSEDPNENIVWVSATKLVEFFKEPFDDYNESIRQSRKKSGKYYGFTPAEIRDIWKRESKRSTDLGTWYHNYKERQNLRSQIITRDGIELPILDCHYEGKRKIAPPQHLKPGIYPEHFVYLKSARVCGQSDRVEIYNNRVYIRDYKTNKELKREGYKFQDGSRKKLLGPLAHLDDCEFNKMALQMSIYMAIILRHNYHLLPGDIIIDHVKFELEGTDQFGYPVYKTDVNGDPIIELVEKVPMPFMEREVYDMFKWLDANYDEKILKLTA